MQTLEYARDEHGDIVIPEDDGVALGLEPGTTLLVARDDLGNFRLRREEDPEALGYENGILVYQGKFGDSTDIVDWIRQDREERIQKLLGPLAAGTQEDE